MRADADCASRIARRRMRAVGQDRRPCRRGRCARAGAGPARTVDASRWTRSMSSCRAIGACPAPRPAPSLGERDAARAGPARADGDRRRSRSSTSRRTAIGCGWSTIPPASIEPGFYGDAAGDYADNAWRFGLYVPRRARGAAGGRAAGRRAAPARLAGRAGGDLPRRCGMPTTRHRRAAAIVTTLHNLAYHGWTANARARPARAAPGDGVAGSERRRHRPARGRDRGGRDRQHGLAGLRRARR